MRVVSVAALLVLIALTLIVSVGTELFIEQFTRPRLYFTMLLASVVISSVAALGVSVEIPD